MFSVTHDIEEAVALSDTIIVIKGLQPTDPAIGFGLIFPGRVGGRAQPLSLGKSGCLAALTE